MVHLPQAKGKKVPTCVFLNSTGDGYGLFSIHDSTIACLLADSLHRLGPVTRAAVYIDLYENMLAARGISPQQLLAFDRQALAHEPEELDLNILLDQLSSIYWRFLTPAERVTLAAGLEKSLWEAMSTVTAGNERKLLFRTYSGIVGSREGQERIYHVWKDQQPPAGVKLSEDDYMGLAAGLALRNYPGTPDMLQEMLERIGNTDRRERWRFLTTVLSSDTSVRDSFFASLHDPVVRRKEAWVLAALSYLHHPLRTGYSEKYLPATLDWLEDIQRTGDVFFPQSWLQTSFSYYQSASAAKIVTDFLQRHPGYNPRLKAKLLQATDNLFRAQKIMK